MKYLGNNIFKLTAWEKVKRIILHIYYPLCVIPYVYMLIGQPFRCIASSFFISLIGGAFILFAVWQKEGASRIVYALSLAFAPGFFLFILAPFLLVQQYINFLNND